MKTNNIYYGVLYKSTSVNLDGFFPITYGEPIKRVLVRRKENICGKIVLKDLNKRAKYTSVVPLEIGKLYVDETTLKKFNTLNNKNRVSKRKIKEIAKSELSKEI